MAATPQPAPVPSPTHMTSVGPAQTAGDLAQTLPGFDPWPVINAQEQSLAAYLNQPVHDILARLGLPPLSEVLPQPGPPNSETVGGPAASNGAPAAGAPAGAANPIDFSQLIQPITDALGTLGSGQFGNLDPTTMLDGVSQTLQSAGQSVQQAMSGLGGAWQGASATAAGAKTTAAVQSGAEVATQATSLRASVSAVTADVAQARARLIEIINEFYAKLAAIGTFGHSHGGRRNHRGDRRRAMHGHEGRCRRRVSEGL
jgi:uncharacterized protein YukE